MKKFSGIFSALPTPFNKGEVDSDSLIRLIKYQLQNGIDGFVVSGTTSESPCLSLDQKEAILKLVKKEVPSDFPIIVGTGSNNTLNSIEQSKLAQSQGASAVMCVVPYYNKPPQRGLYDHFYKINEAIDIPIILYNVPSRTITSLSVDTIVQLSKLKNIVGIKEASGDMNFDSKVINSTGSDFLTVSGDDPSFIQFLSTGGDGIISVISNLIPKEFVSIFKNYKKGNIKKAKDIFNRVKPLIEGLNFDSNPIPIKAALNIFGLFETREVISPLAEALEDDVLKLKEVMYDVIGKENFYG